MNQEFRIALSPQVLHALHKANPQRAGEIGKQAYAYLYREISARLAQNDPSEEPMSFYLDEQILG